MPYPYDIETINRRCKDSPIVFAKECEAIYNRKVMEAAADIAERSEFCPIVFLSGPSGSGKTTTAHKICDAVKGLGIHTHIVSLDKYYLEHNANTPRTEDGEIDLESPHCLDLALLDEHLTALEHGEEIAVPHFSFTRQIRDPKKSMPLKLGKDEIVIFEGIHALNDMIADGHSGAYKLYISARSDVVENGELCFKRTWTRLLRRIVRDELFRGYGASKTLSLWANVREGEKKYISPFKYKADLLFDSSMGYEVPIMKKYAVKALENVPDGTERLSELQELLPALMEFEEIDSKLVPEDSILREFIGGLIYYK